jgi:hypothetical protein
VSQRDLATNVSTNVDAGKTEHKGIEAGLGVAFIPQLRLDTAISYARHRYFDGLTATANLSGKNIESAPRVMANTRLTWRPLSGDIVQLEWIRISRIRPRPSSAPPPSLDAKGTLWVAYKVAGAAAVSHSSDFGVVESRAGHSRPGADGHWWRRSAEDCASVRRRNLSHMDCLSRACTQIHGPSNHESDQRMTASCDDAAIQGFSAYTHPLEFLSGEVATFAEWCSRQGLA